MKIATFNVQNLFHRDKSFSKASVGKCVINWIDELDYLIRKSGKSSREIDRVKELFFLLGFDKVNRASYAVMRKRAGELFFRGHVHSTENKADELSKWNGWVEIQTIPVDAIATQNKARAVAEVNADVLLLQEIEDRDSLLQFNDEFLLKFNCVPYSELLVLQGNDRRGQEIGILTKNGFCIEEVRTYMNELDENAESVFDRNFLKYEITTPSKNRFLLLAAHLKEQGKSKESSDDIRNCQAHRIAGVYQELRSKGHENIIVAGTLNAASYCYSLVALLQKTDLKDISRHGSFKVDVDHRKSTNSYRMKAYRTGVNIKQKDYLLLSPEMFARVKNGGINRKAVWPVKSQWPVYNTVKTVTQAASEHHVVWGEMDI